MMHKLNKIKNEKKRQDRKNFPHQRFVTCHAKTDFENLYMQAIQNKLLTELNSYCECYDNIYCFQKKKSPSITFTDK